MRASRDARVSRAGRARAAAPWATRGDDPVRRSASPAAESATRRARWDASGMGGKAAKPMVLKPAQNASPLGSE